MQIRRQEVNSVGFIMPTRTVITRPNILSQIKPLHVTNVVMLQVGIGIFLMPQKFLLLEADANLMRTAH